VIDPTQSTSEAELYTPSASRLATLFYSDLADVGRFEPSTVENLPPEHQALLAHTNHMTVALETFHQSPVAVHVLDEWRDEASYARCSLLSRRADGAFVQFGIMRIWLSDLPAAAQEEIASKKEPLGRVLIKHNVLREVEVIKLWQIMPGPELQHFLKVSAKTRLYGRTAQILLDERPTVQLLEIVKL
jgi:chorismate-pyruvate lyase